MKAIESHTTLYVQAVAVFRDGEINVGAIEIFFFFKHQDKTCVLELMHCHQEVRP